MRVCFLAGTLGRGGAERQLMFMLESLIRMDVDVKLLCLTRGESFEEEIRRIGVDIDWVGEPSNRLARVVKVARSVANWSADILQSSHFYTNIYAGLAARINRIVSIGAIRSDLTSELDRNGIYGKSQLSLPHHLIANSQAAVDRAIRTGVRKNRIDFVPNAIKGTPLPARSFSSDNRQVNISFVGRLSPEKRPELFVELASRLCSELPAFDLQFRMAGDGPMRERVQQLIVEKSLNGHRFSSMGELSDLSDLYNETDLLVLTSSYEGTPNVILEAMACGIPVVAPEVGGVPEIVSSDRGILFPPSDFEALVAASKSLITDRRMRRQLGANARAFTARSRSINGLAAQLIEIYGKLLRKHGS
ncbi:MAG: glycosyltransferase family 4 protein [Acidobacteria bacterium]|nr:glycosyltransferase family 4 protein [Acidobacteriota bacterium]